MDVVIEKFYNTINVNCDNELLDGLIDIDYFSEKTEIMRKARESGITIKELSMICNLSEEEITQLLNQ